MSQDFFKNLPPSIVIAVKGKSVPIDLSVKNNEISNLETSDDFETYIDNYLSGNDADLAYGGYNEQRNLYKRSGIFSGKDSEERNIHIGLDLWAKAGTQIFAALDAVVHSFNYNTGIGNYGPTIILEHKIEGVTFYTLYGHLSVDSIEDIEIGDKFKAGDKIATLGSALVNGDYAPHLHFQIIMDIEDYFGDYPGVCSQTDIDFYLKNCPNPNLLLKLN